MAKKNKSYRKREDVTYNVEEIIGIISESSESDWCKAVAMISWNDMPAKLDIRNMNLNPNPDRPVLPKGVSLTDEEADRLTDILVERDYGSIDVLQKAVDRKKSRFTISSETASSYIAEGKMVIDIIL